MKYVSYLLSVFCVLLFMACAEEGKYTTAPSAHLSFSADTVVFDTLLSTIGSSTKTLAVYNRNTDGLRISNVSLGKGASSPFRINVDGQYLYQGTGDDFEIRGKDSIIVRIEVTPPEVHSTDILSFNDQLIFTLESGIHQSVLLTAGSMDAVYLRGLVIDSDTTFTSDYPIVIYDSLVIAPNATLNVSAGTRLMFHEKAGLIVHGTLHAQGSIECPIVFRSDRLDHMFDYLLYDNTPNRWEGIRFCGDSHDNVLYQCDIHSCSYGIVCDSTDLSQNMLYMEGCVLHYVGGNGLSLQDCRAQVLNSQISNTLGTTVYILGGAYQFIHCTIAQFYPLDANRGDALYLANQLEDGVYHELQFAYFDNCVITGYADDVIMGGISEGQDYACDYLFRNSYLKTVASEDTLRFSSIHYESKEDSIHGEKNYKRFDTHDFIYDFTPDSLSLIRGMANSIYKDLLPFDRIGRSRYADDAPDAGCYEYQYVAP